ncbi:MAG TPA: hypothetical protein VHA14_13300 [Bryobacteraceae bacterium]|nr:hypothetical protein [Bryobacteraceae bacterium]
MRKMATVLVLGGAVLYAQTDPVIEAARKAATAYAQSLPDYVVRRTTSRARSSRNNSVEQVSTTRQTSDMHPVLAPSEAASGWQMLDTITGTVTVDHGRETYSNLQVNGSPAKSLPPGGAWSSGEFSGEMLMVLSPQSAAVFKSRHEEVLRSRPAIRYNFSVDRAHSAWDMSTPNYPGFSPAYTGRIWIDKETGQPVRIEMTAHGLPHGFPVSSVESQTDYNFVKIGDGTFLLPVHSETLSCEPGGTICLRNETDFSDFNKFETNSNITFGDKK